MCIFIAVRVHINDNSKPIYVTDMTLRSRVDTDSIVYSATEEGYRHIEHHDVKPES